ncbi:hypothetical protein FB566_4585 [Stackebrandtia endophytica]|uniref:Uncharacterized protein n=1 Tax=Stackebrandtia endophytica TaxID=1496996 RepID=A0A543B2E8_9ACTN|nr:hypothetical protein [Stackebrandtia endophytica]TQL78986.1 hypothetical protein FB566_4585 [Stackebrandtia endophytica]
MSTPAPDSVTVSAGTNWRDLAWLGFGLVASVFLVVMIATAGDDLITTRDPHTRADGETPVWLGALMLIPVVLLWPVLRVWTLIAGRRMAVVDAAGLRLFPASFADLRRSTPSVTVTWDQVDRVVLWRRRMGPVAGFSWWRTRLGVELSGDYYEIHAKEPTVTQRASRDIRKDGVPRRLGVMMPARSVACGPRRLGAVADAVTRFAPNVPVVDERALPGGE